MGGPNSVFGGTKLIDRKRSQIEMPRQFDQIPENLSREDILLALASIDKSGIPEGRGSSTYDVLFEGKLYPPPLVVGRANLFANGRELISVKGGRGTKCFRILEKFGFSIQVKRAKEDQSDVETSFEFALEAHLEEFLIRNWSKTSFGREFDILKSESGELIGRQYQTDVGPIDILAISKDRKTYLVVELKRGTSSDRTIGQVLRYIGYVSAEEAENDQDVRGVIVGTAENKKLQRAISVMDKVTFVKYSLHFQLDGDSFGAI